MHPTWIPGEDKLRLMSESARGEGGRVWVPRTAGDKRDPKSIPEKERWYFLEEWYPKYGNLVPRDVATRAIFKVVYEEKLGIDGKPMVYLDLTHIDRKTLDRKLEGILEIYEKFVGDDPRDMPMKIFPGMHYTMGGLWVDYKQAHKRSRHLRRWRGRIPVPRRQPPGREFADVLHLSAASSPARMPCSTRRTCRPRPVMDTLMRNANVSRTSTPGLMKADGNENPFLLWRELGEVMTENCTVIRYNKKCQAADAKVVDLLHRFQKINLSDRSQWANTTVAFARQLYNMLQLSRVIAQGAAMRDESRGSHYKPDFPERDDKNWMKTTKASFAPDADEPKFEFEPVDAGADSAAAEEVLIRHTFFPGFL